MAINVTEKVARIKKLKKIFSHFFPSRCSLVSEGSSRRIFPKSLANPIQPGNLPSVAKGRGTARRTRR